MSGVYRPVPRWQQRTVRKFVNQPAGYFTGSVTPTGTLSKTIIRTLSGSITPTGTLSTGRTQTRNLSGSITPTGSLARGRTTFRTFTGSVTPTGALRKQTNRTLSASSTPSGSFTPSLLPISGTWTAPVLTLPGDPVIGSLIVWTKQTPAAGSTAIVLTSIDNGATWDVAISGSPIPRLPNGFSSVRAVLLKVMFTRLSPLDAAPSLSTLALRVDLDKAVVEYVPLGRFTLDDVKINDGPGGITIDMAGSDLSAAISAYKWERVLVIPAGTNMIDAIRQVVANRYPGLEINAVNTAEVAPRPLVFGAGTGGNNDPFEDIQDIAQYLGCEAYLDARGILKIVPEPDPELGDPVFTFTDRSKSVINNVTRNLTNQDTFNYIIVTGETPANGGVAVQAIAADTDPSSQTYIYGAYGIRALRITSSLVTNVAQALVMANALLLRYKGLTETADVNVICNPAIEEGDIVVIDRSKSGMAGNHLVDGMSIPLSVNEDMRITTRKQKALASRNPGGGVGGLNPDPPAGGGGGGTSPRTYTTPGEALHIGTNGAENHFKVQTAFPGDGAITEKTQAEIGAGYIHSPEFVMNTDRTAVQFRVRLDAPTTSGSTNPRTELREMQLNGTTNQAFNDATGIHYIQATQKITKVPNVNKSLCVMQLHDGSDDVIQILTRDISGTTKLMYRINGTDNNAWVLESPVPVGEYTVRLAIESGVGKIYYHSGTDTTFTTPMVTCGSGGVPAISTGSGNYLKAGCYPQQTTSESPTDYAAMEMRKLGVFHPGYAQPVYDSDTVGGGAGGAVDSFTFAFGSCINASGSNALTNIKNLAPDYFAILGDVYYDDGSSNHQSHWQTKFNESRYAALLNQLPNPQIVSWSDHDFGFSNNGYGAGNPGGITAAANSAYRAQFPGLDLPATTGIYRTWVRGRVRFVLLDCMSFKSPNANSDNSSKTVLGSTQKAWYKNILSTANEPVIVVLGDGQLGGPTQAGQDEWRGYNTERNELASAVSAASAAVIFLEGDTHSLAYAHDLYGYNRVWRSAPLRNQTKVKAGGADYIATHPTNANEDQVNMHEQFAVISFEDSGTSITMTFRGYEGTSVQITDTLTV